MGAYEVITGRTTAVGGTLTNLTMHGSDSLTVRDFPAAEKAWLVQAWVDSQGDGDLRIKGPQFANDVEGIKLRHTTSQVFPLFPWGMMEPLFPGQTIDAELSGSATAGDFDNAALLLYYNNLPGITQQVITPEDLKARMVHIACVKNTLTVGAGGGYTGEEAINAEEDVLKANTQYALLGMVTSIECLGVFYRGTFTGNLRVGVPGNPDDKEITANWFVTLSQKTGIPSIPILAWDDRANIRVDAVQDENATAVVVTTILAELAPA